MVDRERCEEHTSQDLPNEKEAELTYDLVFNNVHEVEVRSSQMNDFNYLACIELCASICSGKPMLSAVGQCE